ncbi:unnamed protein product [Protopolystoma xenopodis]|uniref:Homeobox domain-containing protein n=1 Tax=Protopolystoma xenopodis TaxID=117903 RepID=A0A3S5CT87_9PLAT|nr:unnamed protein product [Protopolystoma xenopodis]
MAHLRCTWQEFQSLPTFRADLTAASLLHSLMALPIAGQVVWNSGDAVSSKGMPTSSASVCTSAIGQAGQHESAKRTLTPSAPDSALAPEPASNEFPSAASTACGQLNWPFGHHSNHALQTVLPRTNYALQTADEDGFEAADYAEALSRFPASGLGTVWNRLTDGAYTLRSATAIRQQRDAGESELRMCLMALEKDITDQSISRTTVRRRSVDECTEDLPIRGPVSRRYRKARVYFQPQHTAILEAAYNKDNYLASKEREVLAKIVGVSEERIASRILIGSRTILEDSCGIYEDH